MQRLPTLGKTLFFLIISTQCLFSQAIIQKVVINPLYRANVYLSFLPENYKSTLSSDKRKVNILIKNANVPDSVRRQYSNNIFQDIYFQNRGSDVEINIILRQPRGYTAVTLPYSKTIIVDVFDWDRLSPAEEHYRTGLLALENKIESAMQKELAEASKNGIADANAFLALNELCKGNILNSINNLKLAAYRTTIHDVFAAISQIYTIARASDKAQKYANYFKRLSGLGYYDNIFINYSDELNRINSEPRIYIDKLDEINIADSIMNFSDSARTTDTTGLSRFNKVLSDNLKEDNNQFEGAREQGIGDRQRSILPAWLGLAAIITIVLIIISGVLIGIAYIRWKNKRIKSLSGDGGTKQEQYGESNNRSTFSGQAIKNKAMQAYRGNQNKVIKESEQYGSSQLTDIDKKKASSKNIITSQEQKEKLHIVLSKISEKDNNNERDNDSKFHSIADEMESVNKIISKEEDNEYNPADVQTKLASKAQLEFAKALQREQQRIKEENIHAINKGEIKIDMDKIIDVAKKLGIEQETIRIKKAINNDESDTVKSLKEKFKG